MRRLCWIVVVSILCLPVAHARARFLVGANIADWECLPPKFCNYSRDIGNNYWQKENMPKFEWKANFRPELWERVFSDLKGAGATTVRIPLMTEGQGMVYENRTTAKGVDAIWLQNVVTILDLALKYGIRVDAGILLGNVPLKKNFFSFYYGQRMLIKSPERLHYYLENIVAPLLDRIAHHPALWAIDVLGEADGLLTEHKGHINEQDIRYVVSESVQFIKKRAPHIPLTASTGYWKHVEPSAILKLLGGLGLDFYDVHLYNQNGDIANCKEWKKLNRPVLLGEFGLRSPDTREVQHSVSKNFVQNAKRCGFMGALAWVANPGKSPNPEIDRYQNLYSGDGTFKQEFRRVFQQE